ncbi:hypothetical protein TrVE_jg5246 [Triparma verrucosa]|uniref:CRC domain-containing protein n=2 Tax=Triparma TaxID=722752 RepID=A0A9W7B638_9STRA|nr:hypothetical protein TrST_g2960 [Triparma strigata]GMH84719.1 hypothetical protein TrVE_jg5246 [Triparma verrucosa]
MPSTPLRKVLASQQQSGRKLFEKDLLDDIPFSPGGLYELGLDFTPVRHNNPSSSHLHPASHTGASPFTDFVNTSLTPLNTHPHALPPKSSNILMSPSSILRKPLISSPPLSRAGWVRVEIGGGPANNGFKEINKMTWRSPPTVQVMRNVKDVFKEKEQMIGEGMSGPPVLHKGTGMGRTNKKKIVCNCKKSKCLKLYCECFAALQECDGCNCNECRNVSEFREIRDEAIRATKSKNPNAFRQKINSGTNHSTGCRCKKSFCLKKYCECYEANVFCGDKCRCANCANYVGSTRLVERRRKIKDHKGADMAVKAAEEFEREIGGFEKQESPMGMEILKDLGGVLMSPRDFGKEIACEKTGQDEGHTFKKNLGGVKVELGIFKFLNNGDLFNAGLVSKKFKERAFDEELWSM